MESVKNRLEIEREYTLTPKIQKLNQKVHCRAEDGTWRASLARSRRAGGGTLSKNHFVPLLTLLVCLFLRHRDVLDGKRSFSDHARTTRGLQNWTLCTTKHLPTRLSLPSRPHHRRWGRCRCCRRRRRPGLHLHRSCGGEKHVKFIALDKAFPCDYEQAAAAGKPAPALGQGPAGNKRHRVRYRDSETQ